MDQDVPPAVIIFTVIVLLILGIFFGITIKKLATPHLVQTEENSRVLGITPLTKEPVSLSFNLTSPDDNLLSFQPQVLVSGQTGPNLPVIISSTLTNQVVSSDKTGSFSSTVKLQKGVNFLEVGVFDSLGNKKLEKRSIYYSEEKI